MAKRPAAFRSHQQPTRQVQNREFDHRRGSAASRGYDGVWAKASRGHKAKHPLCIGCEAMGLVVAVYVTDHVVPGTSGTPEFWNSKQWQSACKWHHDVVKQRLERMWIDGRIGAADLWLNSPIALRLAADLGGGSKV